MFEIDKSEILAIREVIKKPLFYVAILLVCTWSYLHFAYSLPFVGSVIFGAFLVVFTFVDLKHYILPDILMFPAILIGLIAAPTVMGQGWLNTFLGAGLGFGLFFMISFIFFKIRGYHGLGFGDVKFLAMLGAWVGASSLPPLLLISSFVAIPVFILRMIFTGTKTSSPLPFGPFLAVGGWFMLLYDMQIWALILQARKALIQGIIG